MDLTTYFEKTPGGLIPILNPLDVECTLYMLRLTPDGRYSKTHIEAFLGSLTENWVCAKENSKKAKEHYHCTIYDSFEEDFVRTKIREFLGVYFTEPPKRGDANKQYNLTIADSVEKGINYTVKELEITYGKGMNPEYMDKRIKASFLKFDRASFQLKIEKLKKDFKESYMSIGEFMEKFCILKSDYRQPINLTYVYQLAISCEINRDNKCAEKYVRNFLENKNI